MWWQKKKKILLFIAITRNSVSLKLILAVIGQKWKENNCLGHQNISEPLDGIYGLKAVHETLLEVSAKIGEAKSIKELEFFNTTGFDYDQELWESLI